MPRFLYVAVLAVASAALPASAQPADLFLSEYVEGSSNNKALELYNGTGAPIDLAAGGYNVQVFFNGSGTAGLTVNLTGTVATGDVFVLAQSSADAAILAAADQTNGSGWFNGDDAVVLRRGTTVLDAIGQVGFDPGTEWGSGLTSTADNTLRRKPTACTGDVDTGDAFDPSVLYDGFATNAFDGLGAHTASCGGTGNTAPAFTATLADQTVDVGVPFAFTYEATDADGDALTFSLTDGPATATLDPVTGAFAWTPSAADAGLAFPVVVAVSDGTAEAETSATLTVAGTPSGAPTFTVAAPDTLLDAGTPLAFDYDAEDPEADVLAYALEDGPAGAAIDPATGVFSWTPSTTGVYPVTVTVTDGTSTVATTAVVGVRGTLFPGLTGADLRAAVRAAYTPAQTLGYGLGRDVMYGEIDRKPDGSVVGVYTGFSVVLPDGVDPSAYLAANGINAEHTWPQSKGAADEPGRSDLHNLFPAKDNVNSARSNKPYGEIPDVQTQTWYRLAQSQTTVPTDDVDAWSESASGVFEPREVHKGNAARAAVYFFSVYEAVSDESFLLLQKDALTAWDALDPADAAEVVRTYEVSLRQGNLNPFLLDATLVERAVSDVVPPEPVLVAHARTQPDGTLVTVDGVVTRAEGRFARLQDATAGITVFQTAGPFRTAVEAGDVAEGDAVRVTGTLTTFNGLLEIEPAFFEVLSRGNALPAPALLTLAEVAASGEAYESELVRVEGLTLETTDAVFAATRSYTVSDGTGTLILRTPAAEDGLLDGEPVPAGPVVFEGVLSDFRGAYQLQPVLATDVRDETPPVIVLAAGPRRLFPANHRLVTFDLADLVVSVTDAGAALDPASVVVTRATSDEAEDGVDDGATAGDVAFGGCRSVSLRAERVESGNGRVYTVYVAAADAAGNVGEGSFTVEVPTGRQSAVVADAPVYAVASGCEPSPATAPATLVAEGGPASSLTAALPSEYALSPNAPNPFSSSTEIRFALPEAAAVRLAVYDVTGREVAVLAEGSFPAGEHGATWRPAGLSSGVYLVRLEAGPFVSTRRMLLVR